MFWCLGGYWRRYLGIGFPDYFNASVPGPHSLAERLGGFLSEGILVGA
jgi:hypothetical protein